MSVSKLSLALLTVTLVFPAFAAGTGDTRVSIELPSETARFAPGPGADLAQSSCMVCHSADYVYMQPPLKADKWQAEVEKMRKVYGCPVPEKDIKTLVEYLVSQNGAR